MERGAEEEVSRKRKQMPKRKAVKAKAEDEFSDPALTRIVQQALEEGQAKAVGSLKWLDVECPYCGEEFEVRVDPSEEGQEMIQDCNVCCKSIQLSVEVEDGEVAVFAYRS